MTFILALKSSTRILKAFKRKFVDWIRATKSDSFKAVNISRISSGGVVSKSMKVACGSAVL